MQYNSAQLHHNGVEYFDELEFLFFLDFFFTRVLAQWKMDGNKRNLDCFYSIFAKKRNSHSQLLILKYLLKSVNAVPFQKGLAAILG
jgi:hypothetical protein